MQNQALPFLFMYGRNLTNPVPAGALAVQVDLIQVLLMI